MANQNQGEEYVFYDNDRYNLARTVEKSPQRYSILRSMAPRFAELANDVPFGAYNLDTGSKKTMESTSRDTRRFYAASFDSKVPRFGRPWSTPVNDTMYDVQTTTSAQPSTLGRSVECSPVRYAIHRSKQKRFNDKPLTEAPDVVYELDAGNKQTLYTAMLKSSISYRNMGAGSKHDFEPSKAAGGQASLGPGSYDFPYAGDATYPPLLAERPLSSFVSLAHRFPAPKGGIGLGSTYRPENDTKDWLEKSKSISKAEYLRPQYLPKVYMKKQLEQHAAVATAPPHGRGK